MKQLVQRLSVAAFTIALWAPASALAGKPEVAQAQGQNKDKSDGNAHHNRRGPTTEGRDKAEGKSKRDDKSTGRGAKTAAENRPEAGKHHGADHHGADHNDNDGGATGEDHAADPDTVVEQVKARAEERRANRANRAKQLRSEARKRAKEALHGTPMQPSFKQEMRRHARRMARLHRLQAVAAEAGNTEAMQRVDKLLSKENTRHDRWVTGFTAKPHGKAGKETRGNGKEKNNDKADTEDQES